MLLPPCPQINSSLVLPIDEVAPDDVDSSGEPVDAKLYTTFWGLQNVFKVRQATAATWQVGNTRAWHEPALHRHVLSWDASAPAVRHVQ
jgi:hypothetical protein